MDALFLGLREIPNIHPIVVHFPVALLPLALGFDLLGLLFGSHDLHAAGRWCLWAGTVAAGAAVLTGLDGAEHVHTYVSDAAEAIMETHMRIGYGVLGASVGLSFWRLFVRPPFPARGRFAYLILALATVVTMDVGADLGGQMVFLHGVAVRADADSLQGGEEKGHAGHHHHPLGGLFGGEEEEAPHEHHD